MKTTWQRTYPVSKVFPTLVGHDSCDCVIVGGGITGITCAYLLAQAGKKVIVVEKGTLAESVTAYTTAFLSYEIDTALEDLERMFGKEDASRVWKSGMDAIGMIEEIIQNESIECEFTRCYEYAYSTSSKRTDELMREAEYARNAGFPVSITSKAFPFSVGSVVLFDGMAKLHPLKYCDGLRRAAEKYGAIFYENTEALGISGSNTITLITPKGSISASFCVIATYNPFNRPRQLFAKKGMYISYIYELSIPQDLFKEGLYVDSDNPYHYFRIDKNDGHDRMIIGGEDHREEIHIDPKKNWKALLSYTEKILGNVSYSIVTKWSGPILETWDGLPFIGRYSQRYKNRLVATGFSGNGMTYSMIAARVLSDIILHKHNSYADLYSPKRGYSFRALSVKGRDYLEEFFDGAVRNFFNYRKK